tara:strand:- start:702 stop:1385 length:684 start_codon:yes stop_codon:yes gene_type:complete
MKNVIILDCGPSLEDVSKEFGQSPDWIISSLKEYDINFTWIKSHSGEKIEENIGDAWIITGSPRSVYDEEVWMQDLEISIRNAAKINKPILGICFGHQLVAKSFGGVVALNPKGWELGSYPIYLTNEGQTSPLFKGVDNRSIVYESHKDIVSSIPKEAIVLASNDKGNQSFQLFDSIFGVQFHPEFSIEIIRKYVSIRSAQGVPVDDPVLPKSKSSHLVLHNFINII